MQSIAQQLISEEFHRGGGDSSDSESRAAFRVCEKLRRRLSIFAGLAGFRALVTRALTLAKTEVPWLGGLRITPEGSIPFEAELEAQLSKDEAVQGGTVLVSRLVELLVTFMGQALTMRLIQDLWPKTALKNLKSKESL